ncbi:MAG: dihydrofolate reductase [Saprospiraceae bacterium]|nr:dihydrofolate reductase [Saprospiraceae bacterium]
MRKVILYIAASLDGYIADVNGGVEWLESIPNPDKTDYGYQSFYDNIEATIMGYGTFQQLIDWDIPFPYIGKDNYVVTRKSSPPVHPHVSFITEDHLENIKKIKQREGGNIWLIGGSQLNTFFLNNDLIDTIHIFTMPIILNDGFKIFSKPFSLKKLKLTSTERYTNGVIRSVFDLNHYSNIR